MHAAALTLGLSSLALTAFPLVRPFFPFDPRTPAETLAGASRAVTSVSWLIAHYLALIGFVLLLCVLELYVLPAIGRVYLDGNHSVAALVGLIYRGAAVLVMLLGLLLLAIGAVIFARAVTRSGALPRWAAVTYAVGLAFWCPLLPAARPHRGRPADRGGRPWPRVGAAAVAPLTVRPPPRPAPPRPAPHPALSP